MSFRAYGVINDVEHGVLVMGTKTTGYLAGFLVLFGGKTEPEEPSKDSFLRELAEESHQRVHCPPDDVHRFQRLEVTEPTPASLLFFRCTNPTYTTGEIPHGTEIGSVVAVSVAKVLKKLPENPEQVTPTHVANALIDLYGGGADVATYRSSGTIRALRDYLVMYYHQ